MNQRTKSRVVRRRAVASLLIVPAVALLGACGDEGGGGVGVDVEGNRFLEEAFDFVVEDDVQFGSALDENGLEEALRLDLYVPTNDGEGLRPAIIWLHGGSFQNGHSGQMTEFASRFAQRGYVSASATYRLRENAEFDYTDPDDALGEEVKRDAQHDVQAAVRWLRANASGYRIDPNFIFVAGYSAGATTALRVGAWPDDPGESGNPEESSEVAAAVAIAASLDPGVLDEVDGSTLLIHGESDTKISFAAIEEACSAAARCQLVAMPGGHDLVDVAQDDIVSETALFLRAEISPS